ncbi:autotransporter outer membrane beta-barrel domain-containing protein [Pseudomonas donghuensis]|uniref:autotransporter outer membrane beta-barrel domain-containing protein n=1 Tax=Pseudomonas donghuensis TaxID=1163398 RepID=UPI000C2B1F97|nr:autotransporter domain-containing protein [Pseudomonas donghuensis]PJY96597.1 autotransporter outer membrane beta-barrel domain-containing protein [Pseudomonas donghuensis]UVL22567.1 autotransporter domain-containing protein [Pseudomonas donghuensis]WKY26535.1 autotransporter domain-containing protein [Pseudomonas donghuensis]
MFKPLAVAVSLGCAMLSSGASAYEYGEFAGQTLDRLINDYPGRYRGTASFEGATALMQSQLGFGYQTRRQDFTWAGNRSSQNVIASAPGQNSTYVVLGAHYDTYFGRPTLQGLDDNASGAAVLTEIARNLGGVALENGLEVVGFGAEEEGLRGSRAYVASLSDSQRANLLGMINLDSLITGDKMYAHAASNSVANPALGAYRDQLLRIAQEMNIPLFTNPGLNPEYPAGTGCCSDGESFKGLNVPVLFIEATNWELGELDGYEQTGNPAIPGGSTWHDPAEDNQQVLTHAFGQERIDQRLRDFSRLLTRLVLELTNADLLASTASGGAMARQMEDQLQRQHQALTRLHDRRWLSLLDASRAVGSVDGEVGVEGEVSPDSGFDAPGNPESKRVGVYGVADYRLNEALTVGASLSFQRSRDSLEHGGRIEGDAWQAGLFALLNDGGPQWLAGELSAGHTRFDSKRSVYIQANNGPVLLDQRLSGDTSAWFWGARLDGGYDFSFGALKTGPVAGLDYMHYRIDDFSEDDNLRTALGYEQQNYDALEASLGWRLHGSVGLGANMALQPYASVRWVRELADGRLDEIDLTSHADGRVRVADMGSVDKDFGRAQLGAQLMFTEQLGVFAEVNSRFAHSEGNQAGYSLGVQWQF